MQIFPWQIKLLPFLVIFFLLAACVIYSNPSEDRNEMHQGRKVSVVVERGPDMEGVIHDRKGDSIQIFFDRPPEENDLEWYSVYDEKLQVHNKLLSILAGTAFTIGSTFIIVSSLSVIALPIIYIILII